MTVKWKLILFGFVYVVKIQSFSLKNTDYSPEYFQPSSEHENNLRQKFLNRRRQNLVTEKRLQLIDKYLSNNSIFIDGIIHEKVNKKNKQWKLVDTLEKSFRNLIAMNGVTYYFRRDPYWRTWRKVEYPEGDKMVCYKCENNIDCDECQYAGHWAIDPKPPCPYEIVSVINNAKACAVNFGNSTNVFKPCPTVAEFTDIMRECDNPTDTEWRIQKSYKKGVSERYPSIFCNGRDFCTISTLYTITHDYVSFRIMNSSNHIIYSKIMKNNETNYACASDCGILDPKTKTVSKTGQPLIVDLINNKNKREYKNEKEDIAQTFNYTHTEVFETEYSKGSTVFDKTTATATHKLKLNKLKHAINEMETTFYLPVDDNKINDDFNYHQHHKKNPTCSSMKHRMEDEMSDEINSFY